MAQIFAGPGLVPKGEALAPDQIPPKPYSVIRLVGCFGFYACLILLAFTIVGLRDLNLAGLTLAGAAGFGFVWLFGAIEMRLIMLDEALRRVAAKP